MRARAGQPAGLAATRAVANATIRFFPSGKTAVPSPSESAKYRHCQSLVRGQDLLAAFNAATSATASISELARFTGLHRTTIKRLLETLRETGYVQHDPLTNLYRLTFRVQSLAAGFRDDVSIAEYARPAMRALSKQVVWPCSLTTLEADEMVVRSSTCAYSPLSFHPGMPGRRMPLLTTSAGRAYFSYAPPAEQDVLLAVLRARDDASARLAEDERWLRAMVRATRKRGYAINEGEWEAEPKFGAVAVPLRQGQRVLATMNVIYLQRAVERSGSMGKIAAALQEAAHAIEAGFAAATRDIPAWTTARGRPLPREPASGAAQRSRVNTWVSIVSSERTTTVMVEPTPQAPQPV